MSAVLTSPSRAYDPDSGSVRSRRSMRGSIRTIIKTSGEGTRVSGHLFFSMGSWILTGSKLGRISEPVVIGTRFRVSCGLDTSALPFTASRSACIFIWPKSSTLSLRRADKICLDECFSVPRSPRTRVRAVSVTAHQCRVQDLRKIKLNRDLPLQQIPEIAEFPFFLCNATYHCVDID
jgi:hypothetical protein